MGRLVAYLFRMGLSQRLKSRARRFLQRPGTTVDLAFRKLPLEHLFETPVDDSYVGNFRIDRYGDTTRTTMGVYRVKDGKLEFDTAVTPPADLFARE